MKFPFLRRVVLAVSAVATAPVVLADEAPAPRFYVGAGAGMSDFRYTDEKCTRDLGMPCSLDNKDSAVKVFVGINVQDFGSVELSRYDLGALTANVGGVTVVEEQSSVSIAWVGQRLYSEKYAAFLRFGVHSTDLEVTGTGSGGSVMMSDKKSSIVLGIGASATVNRHIALRAEYERLVQAGDADSDIAVLSGAVVVSF